MTRVVPLGSGAVFNATHWFDGTIRGTRLDSATDAR